MEQSSCIKVLPLPNDETLSFLRDYNEFLKTIFMKKLKSFTSIGGCSDFVSADSLKKLELTDEVCVMINVIISKLSCYNVYSGILMSGFLLKLWSETWQNHKVYTINLALTELRHLLDDCIESLKLNQDCTDLCYLQSLVIPLLVEEKSIWLEDNSLDNLSLQIIKAVLSVSQTENSLRFGFVRVHVSQGEDSFQAVNGVLCEIDDVNFKLVKHSFLQEQSVKKILLFSETLNENVSMIEEVIGNVNAIFCQKKISDYFKVFFRRKHILIIERGGEELVKSVQHITGAVPISNLGKLVSSDVKTMIGCFTDVRVIDESRNLISIENKDCSSLAYVYIKCRSFSNSSLIKNVVDNCIFLLKSVLSSPYYLPGPNLLEKKISHYLDEHSIFKSATLKEIISVFINILKEISKLYASHPARERLFPKHSFLLKRNAILQAMDGVINILSLSCVIRKPI